MKANQFFDQFTHCFKGGGGGKQKPAKLPPAPEMPAPVAPPPPQLRVEALERSLLAQQQAMLEQNRSMERTLRNSIKPPEPPPPPATMSMLEVQDAQDAARRDAGKRSGMRKTLLAGETGGYSPTATGKTLLG